MSDAVELLFLWHDEEHRLESLVSKVAWGVLTIRNKEESLPSFSEDSQNLLEGPSGWWKAPGPFPAFHDLQ